MATFGVSIYSISRLFHTGEMTPEEGIKWLADEGAEAIEMVPFGIDFIGDPSMIDKCRTAAEEAGVKIDNFSLNANFLQIDKEAYDAEVARVKSYIDVAHKLGCESIRVDCSAFRRPIETNTTAHFILELPTVVETYKVLCDYAKQYDMDVLLENHGFHINGSERTAHIFEAMKGYNFGAQIDCGNFICVDEPAEVAVKKSLPYIKTVHMKDFYVRPADRDPGDASDFNCSNSWFRSVQGKFLRGSILAQGDLDIPGIIKDIKDSGFDGRIYIEYEGMEDCLYGTKVSLDNLKRIWNNV